MALKNSRVLAVLGLIVAAVLAYGADNRTKLKPGFNFFSPQQDVEIGRQSARQAERQEPMLNDREATSYIESLGKSLARYAPNNNSAYVYQFKIVNDTAINAFALPGGFLYVNRGAITAGDNEAQIAGVIAHEIGHVVMRHGTHQASRAYLAQAPLAAFGGVLGGSAIGSVLGAVGGVGMNVLFLKYSRDMESQADLIGTQILHDAGYEPKAMVEFFEKIQAESKGRASQFLSDHPNPENRISNVQHEIEKLNGALPDPKKDTPDFQSVKSALMGMAPPSRSGRPTTGGTNRRPTNGRSNGTPANPSTRLTTYSGTDMEFRYPDNWHETTQGSTVTIAPDGGMINGSLTWGLMVSLFEPEQHAQGPVSLEDTTDQLLNALQRNNSSMRITRSRESIRVGGRPGYVTELSNDSPAGGRETDWIVTTIAPDGKVYYFVGVVPQNDFSTYNLSFQDIIDTVRFRN
jgi:predicted Zn-dependent protease